MSVSSPLPPRRPNRRQVSAAATRNEILGAARRLFGERGYAQTSVADIAEEAGVSIPTIYSSVGQKQAIVTALVGLVDFESGGREARSRILVETDPAELVALGARVNRALQETFGDILEAMRSAAHSEPAIATAVANGQRLHRFGASRLADRLAELGALRAGLTATEAADVISILTDVETISTLVGRYGWTFDRAEAWITTTLGTALLKDR